MQDPDSGGDVSSAGDARDDVFRAHALFVRRGDQVTGPFPKALLEHFVVLGRIGGADHVSADRMEWFSWHEVIVVGPIPESDERGAGESDEVDWARERARARFRWIDERAGIDRRQTRPDESFQDLRSGAERRRDTETTVIPVHVKYRDPLFASARRDHAYLYVLACVGVIVAIGLGLWLFVPRLIPHVSLLR